MSYPAQIVYVDLQSSRVFSNTTGQSLSWPTFLAGGVQNIGVRFLTGDGSGGYVLDASYASRCASIRCGLGIRDYSLNGGQYRLVIQEGTTAFIPYSASAKQVQDALNSLIQSNPFTCERDATGIYLSRDSGAYFAISFTENTLLPQSFISFRGQTLNGKTRYKMTFEAAPLAFTSGGDQVLPPPPLVTTLQHGGADASGTSTWATIQNLYIPPTFQGTFQLSDALYKSDLLDITDGATQIQAALTKMFSKKGSGYTVTVTNPTSFNVHITFDGKFSGTDVPPLLVSVYSAPPADWTVLLNLDTTPLQEYLRGKGSQSLQFEAEADFYVSTPIQGQPLPATFRKKLWSMPITVAEPLIKPEFQTAQAIEWLEPPSGKTYIPFSPNQIITGQQSYTAVLGDGSATTFQLAHNLSSDNLSSILVRQNSSPGRVYRPSEYQVIEVNSNTLSLEFPTAPAANSLVVAITTAGPVSAFLTHTHTISQIDTLADQLDYLGSKVGYLLSLVPVAAIAPAANNQPNAVSSVASFGEILPDPSLEDSVLSISSQVIPASGSSAAAAVPGTNLQEQLATNAAALAALKAQLAAAQKAIADATAAGATVDQAKQIASKTTTTSMLVTSLSSPAVGTATTPLLWPSMRRNNKMPFLFQALSTASVDHSATTPPNPSAGAVYRSVGGITLSVGGGRKPQIIPAGGHFACDGNTFYRVYQGQDSLWHAWEMDREISRFAISSDAFPAGSTLQYAWNTIAALIPDQFDTTTQSPDLFARYTLQILATPASASTVTTPVVLASVPLTFSEAAENRNFALTINRPSDDSTDSSAFLTSYGVKSPINALPWGDVVLSVCLKEFETDHNSSSLGQLSLHVPSSQLTISK